MTASAAAIETGLPPNVEKVNPGIIVRDFGRGNRHADGNAVAHAFRRSDDVRLDVPVLDAEPFVAGATPAGLNFVGDEESAVLVA